MLLSKRLLSYNLAASYITISALLVVTSMFSVNLQKTKPVANNAFQDYAIEIPLDDLTVDPMELPHAKYSFNDTADSNRGEVERTKEVDTTIKGTVSGDDVNFRNYPETYGDVLDCFKKGVIVKVTAKWNDWFKVETQSSVSGWILGKYLTLGSGTQETAEQLIQRIPEEKPKEIITIGQQISNYAKNFLGVRYVWGGSSPNGFDCSGFVKYVYEKYGIYLNRVAADQAVQGTKVSRDSLRAGDLVFFDTDGGSNYINHVGLYIGNGNFIHASSGSSYKVIVSSLYESFYSNTFMTAKRYF